VVEQLLQTIPFDQLLIQTINGIVTGMILALVASGLTLIFGIMDVVNFAHGELFMLGAYVGVITLAATGDFWIALVVSALIVALLGAAIHVTVLRPLLGRHHLTTAFLWCCRTMRSGSSARWPARSRSPSPATSRSSISTIRGTAS
jgi:branched-chain amino acid transport system permease protein